MSWVLIYGEGFIWGKVRGGKSYLGSLLARNSDINIAFMLKIYHCYCVVIILLLLNIVMFYLKYFIAKAWDKSLQIKKSARGVKERMRKSHLVWWSSRIKYFHQLMRHRLTWTLKKISSNMQNCCFFLTWQIAKISVIYNKIFTLKKTFNARLSPKV